MLTMACFEEPVLYGLGLGEASSSSWIAGKWKELWLFMEAAS